MTADALRAGLESARATTLRLIEGLSDSQARRQRHAEFSPLAWHLGHVAWQEEVWALRHVAGRPPLDPELDGIYDSFSSEKASRGRRLPSLVEARAYVDSVRERTLAFLAAADQERDGWVFRFLANHERQHAETMAVIRLLDGLPLEGLPEAEPGEAAGTDWLAIPGGSFVLGSDDDPDGWDNERRAHLVELPAFRIASRPVINEEWLRFIEAGGYRDDALWSEEGLRWRRAVQASSPLHWIRDEAAARLGWSRRTLGGLRPVYPAHPVAHVSWHEAEAFARYAGARLPTEAEWERAASWDEAGRRKKRWPWGDDPGGGADANLALVRGDTTACGRPRSSAAALSSESGRPVDLAGNVWEWTSASFQPFPGFTAGHYAGYSAPWFGAEHRVLRGGCHLTHPALARATFRNWFVPSMRAYPSGLRLAADDRP